MAKDETGNKYGMLQVLHMATFRGSTRQARRWVCRCDCGNIVVKDGTQLRLKSVVSCGCRKSKLTYDRNFKHGKAHTLTWRKWAAMRSRCTNSKASSFRHYGGRGIIVCDRWRDFANFLEDMGECPDGKSLDRINVNGNYEPSNCRWSDHYEQMNNRTIRRIEQFSTLELTSELNKRGYSVSETFSKQAPSTQAQNPMLAGGPMAGGGMMGGY